jgi:hypothetical protein
MPACIHKGLYRTPRALLAAPSSQSRRKSASASNADCRCSRYQYSQLTWGPSHLPHAPQVSTNFLAPILGQRSCCLSLVSRMHSLELMIAIALWNTSIAGAGGAGQLALSIKVFSPSVDLAWEGTQQSPMFCRGRNSCCTPSKMNRYNRREGAGLCPSYPLDLPRYHFYLPVFSQLSDRSFPCAPIGESILDHFGAEDVSGAIYRYCMYCGLPFPHTRQPSSHDFESFGLIKLPSTTLVSSDAW